MSAECKLHKEIFEEISTQLGPLQGDLFATRLNHQLDYYVSWRPDPGENGGQCLSSQPERPRQAMPSPFSLIGKCLQKVRTEQSTVVLLVAKPTAPTGMSQQAKISRSESLRQQNQTTRVSKETSELFLAGWSKRTNTAY